MAEFDLLKAGGLLQLGREGSHLCLQHVCHQIILQAVYQKGHVSASLILYLDTVNLKKSKYKYTHTQEIQIQPDGWLCF